MASELTSQKIYRVGEATAEGDSDQVVVNTLADLFDVKKASSKDHSAQLINTTEALSTSSTLASQTDRNAPLHPADRPDQYLRPRVSRQEPPSNEVRKRAIP